MPREKERTMEDTWKTSDLEKHIRGGVHDEDNMRKKDRRRSHEDGKKSRSGDSVEHRHRDQEREVPRERDRHTQRDGTRERTKSPRDPHRNRDPDRRREATRDRMAEMDEGHREKRRERDREGDGSRARDRDLESRERRHERAEKDSRDREREKRKAERDRERGTERERKRVEGRDGDQEKDREITRDRDRDRDREHDYERRREKERHREREQAHSTKHLKETDHYKDGLQEQMLESKKENERRERPSEREHSRRKEDKEYREHRRKEKEERKKRHREGEEHHDRESRRQEEKPRDEERERRHRERREAEQRLPSDRESRDERPRDKQRERKPREEGDRQNGPVEVSSGQRSHSDRDGERREPKETKVEKEDVEIEKPSAEDHDDKEGAEYYEEDFEDYEEDFEEDDGSHGEEDDAGDRSEEGNEEDELSPQNREEIEEIRRAMNAENERVGSSQQWQAVEEAEVSRKDSDVPQSKSTQHGKFMDFVAAKHREVSKKVASKQKKRSTELLRLIDLDFSISFSLLDLPPVNEYDMYIKSFGTTNTKQAYVQCNEDNTDRDTQTEEIEPNDKWTQHPGDSSTVCGGPKVMNEASDESMANLNIDSKRLAEFLQSATQVVAVLLEEDRAEKHSLRKLKSQADSLSCSDGCLQLNTKLPFLHGREVSLISFSQVQRQTLLSVHSPPSKPSAVRLDSQTILCIWNIWEPSSPQKILVYESEVHCCCFSPGKATLVFAGTAVGSVVAWDLREHSSLHKTLKIGDHDWTLRYPTFSTDAVLSALGHVSSVMSVEPVPAVVAEGLRPEFSLLPPNEESSGLSFQLASLDESGVLNLWVVLELPKADQAGSQTDLGLKPGGKVKLLHSSTIITNERSSQRDAEKTGLLRTLLLKFFPSDSNHFFIGTDMGLVTHGTRHGLKIPPKFYRPQAAGLRPVHVTAVDVSPFGEPVFLVGCADGSIRMHSVRSEQPVMEWAGSTGGEPVVSVQWALTRPTVFCILDAASNIHIWDLLEKDYEPATTEKIQSDRVTAMAVFGDPAKPNTFSGVSLAKQSGKIEIQYFSKKWAVPTPAEHDILQNILREAF